MPGRAVRKPKYYSSFFWPAVIFLNLFLLFWLYYSLSKVVVTFPSLTYQAIENHVSRLHAADCDGDGSDELAVILPLEPYPYRAVLSIFSPFANSSLVKFKFLLETLVPAEHSQILLMPFGPEGKPHALVYIEEPHTIRLLDIHSSAGVVKEIRLEHIFSPGQKLIYLNYYDVNEDGSPDLIAAIESAWTGLPRGLIAYDLKNSKILWQFLMGCAFVDLRMADVDRDGKTEFIISGRSPHNGVSFNGTDDDHSYLICLGQNGRPKWIKSFGGYFTRLFFDLVDLDDDGELEIAMSKACDRVYMPEPGEVRILKASDGESKAIFRQEDRSFSYLQVVSEKGSGPLLAVGNDAGEIMIFNTRLQPIRKITLEKPAIILGQTRLGKGSSTYLYAQAGFMNFYLLDLMLKKKHRFTLSEPLNLEKVGFLKLRNGQENAFTLNADRLYLARENPGRLWASLTTGHGLMALVVALELLILNLVVVILSRRRVQLRSGVEKKDGEWLELAQEVAHWMKNHMFTIRLETEQLKHLMTMFEDTQKKEKMEKGLNAVLEDVDRLNEQVKMFMKLVSQRALQIREVDLNALLTKLANRYREAFGSKIEFVLDLDEEAAVVRADEEQLAEAISNLISNAVEALEAKRQHALEARAQDFARSGAEAERPADRQDKSKSEAGARAAKADSAEDTLWVRLGTSVFYSPVFKKKKGVLLEIEDNGQGMSEEILEKIFQPYFSTKSGGMGIGLTVSKKIIEAHGGKINVYSRPGVGTRFAIYLRG
ncbi:MAG: ATP-binding protein [Candidatus Saccharicenans sp.]